MNINDLADIRDVHIDINKPINERKQSYLHQIKDPYLFRYKKIVVSVEFVGEDALEDKIIQLLKKKNLT